MAEAIDVVRLGAALRRKRKDHALTLREVSDATQVSIATLSRIERLSLKEVEKEKRGTRGIEAETLLRLAEWLQVAIENFSEGKAPPVVRDAKGKLIDHTPDVVELHLRADKKLDKKTAAALARLFRTAYEELSRQPRKK